MPPPTPTPPRKTILLTGSSKGIGLALARCLLRAGHNVFLVARTEAPLRALQAEREFEGRVGYVCGDLGDGDALAKTAVSSALATFKSLDGLVLNHGTLDPVKRIADTTPSEWREAFNVNFFSCIAFITASLPSLRLTHGTIILTSSGAAATSYTAWGAYGSSKSCLNHVAATLGVEEPHVTTIAVRPGVVDTDMQTLVRNSRDAMSSSDAEKFKGLFERGELLRPEQPAAVMARLVVGGGEKLSGRFLSWNAPELKDFQDRA